MDNKKIYVCNKCRNMRIINSNEYTDICNRCGSKDIREINLNFIPKTFSSIKKFTTLEINNSKIKEVLDNNIITEKSNTNRLFISSGVIKVLADDKIIYYIYFYKDNDIIHMEKYDFIKSNKYIYHFIYHGAEM